MPVSGDRYPFNAANVDKSPDEAGVYALYDGDECIYTGRAKGDTTTIRSRVQDHLSGREGKCTQEATHYRREVTSSPVSREKELLEEFQIYRSRLPRCNKQSA